MRMGRGFTLIELVLVIAILGVLSVAAIIAVPSPKAPNLMAAARQVQADIEYAKQNAMMTGTTSGVAFVSGSSYTVYQGTVATPIKDPLTLQNMVMTLSSRYSGVTLGSAYVVEFNSFGAPTLGGGGSVTVTDGTSTKQVSVTANTGLVKIL